MLDKVIRRSDTVDKESLCILAGQRVWIVFFFLLQIIDSGNTGLAFEINDSLFGRLWKFIRLRMLSGSSGSKTFPETRCRSNWRRSHGRECSRFLVHIFLLSRMLSSTHRHLVHLSPSRSITHHIALPLPFSPILLSLQF